MAPRKLNFSQAGIHLALCVSQNKHARRQTLSEKEKNKVVCVQGASEAPPENSPHLAPGSNT